MEILTILTAVAAVSLILWFSWLLQHYKTCMMPLKACKHCSFQDRMMMTDLEKGSPEDEKAERWTTMRRERLSRISH